MIDIDMDNTVVRYSVFGLAAYGAFVLFQMMTSGDE